MADATHIVYTENVRLVDVNSSLAFLAKDFDAIIMHAVSPHVGLPYIVTITIEIKREGQNYYGNVDRTRPTVRRRRMR